MCDAHSGATLGVWRLSRLTGWGPGDPWNCRYSPRDLYVSTGDRAEGAENKASDRASNHRGLGSSGDSGESPSSTSPEGQALEDRMRQLSLQGSKGRDRVIEDINVVQIG